MKSDGEIEYIPLDERKQPLPKQRGFLKRLLDCLSIERVTRYGPSPHPLSGEEVEEDVIEY